MVEFYPYENLGYVVDPESDMKEITVILIGKQMAKCNPRPAVIYVTGGAVDEHYEKLEELKKYCEEQKLVFLCPASAELEELAKTYTYAVNRCKDLNIRRDEISVRAADGYLDAARALAEYMEDEFDAEPGPAEVF